ncbi:MAG: aspartate aminotransferase family protein, partial [Gemmatimonadales bacterium]
MLTNTGTEGSALLEVYQHMPVRPVRGEGSWLVDEAGERWLDAYGGHAVAATGHSHPRVVAAIAEQAATLLFYSAAVPLGVRSALAERLASLCPDPLNRVFFCNSGAEANENALHLARRWTGRREIVTMTGGWHGRTVATLACCDGGKYEAGAERAGMSLSRRARFNDIDALEQQMDGTVAAVLVEPVQGMAGARPAFPGFLRAARELCDRHGAVLIFDEVQCGVGRCGAFTTAESVGVTPDILTMAKGLGSGLPIAAMIASPSVTAVLGMGDLGSTFGGGPVPCAAALATLDVIKDEDLIGNAIAVGEHIIRGAGAIGIERVHGRGLLLGLALGRPARAVQEALFRRRILTGT